MGKDYVDSNKALHKHTFVKYGMDISRDSIQKSKIGAYNNPGRPKNISKDATGKVPVS